MGTPPPDEFLEFGTDRTVEGVVRRVRLSRPAKLNALPNATVDALADFFQRAVRDDADVVTVQADGDDFCVGADMAELDQPEMTDYAESAARMQRLVDGIRNCPTPVVAGVQGRAFGAGFLLCLGVDIVVASDDAVFALPEAGLGLPVAGYASTLLPRLIGERHARDWLFTGRTVDVEEAVRAGFVTRAVDRGALGDEVCDVVNELASNSGHAIAVLKDHMASPTPSRDAIEVRECERTAMRDAFEEGDARDRISAFLED